MHSKQKQERNTIVQIQYFFLFDLNFSFSYLLKDDATVRLAEGNQVNRWFSILEI